MTHLRSAWRAWSRLGLAFGLLGALAASGRSADEDKPRSQQIADIEKQIEALTKQIAELKKANVAPPSSLVEGAIPADWAKAIAWRSIGPASMGGRITALSVVESDPSTYFVATASGGLLKTVNNGITFDHQFDHEATVSIGDVCVAPSDPNVVWVGTGEGNPRNSVSYGDGVYKSTDGGKTWKNVGLTKSFQIGKIIVHPKDPNTVYVGALGRLYGPNEERGLYKTTDGGSSWNKVLYVDDKTGIIDMRMDPTDPETLIVATFERQRDGFDAFYPPDAPLDMYAPAKLHAPGAGLHKTTDGGKTFKKLTAGLPSVKMGRIGLDWSRSVKGLVFAIIDTEKSGTGLVPAYLGVVSADDKDGVKLEEVTPNSPAARAGLKANDVITSLDGKALSKPDDLSAALKPKKPGDKVKLGINRGEEKKEIEVTLGERPPDTGGGGAGGRAGGGGRRGGAAGGPQQMLNPGFLGEDTEDALRVERVIEDGPAAKAGLQEGDVILTVEGKKPEGFRDMLRQLSSTKKVGDKVTLSVSRGGEKKQITIALEAGVPGGGRGASRGRPYGMGLGGQVPNKQDDQGPDGVQTGGVYKSTDAGETWVRVNSVNPRPMYFAQIRVDPSDAKRLYVLGDTTLYQSENGGKTFQPGRSRGVHADHHALWIDPKDGRHMIIGCDGGFYQTYDRGEQWDHLNHLALGQFYHVDIDPRPRPYVYGGLQDNGSWGGPTHTLHGSGPINEDWLFVNGGDGFVCRVDPTNPDLVYAESQGGRVARKNMKTGEQGRIQPRAVPGKPPFRFNWNTPFLLSHHNPSIFYSAGNYVFRSFKRGDDLKIISPEITKSAKGTGSALAESPKNPDVVWAGTDDGNLWVTRDGGVKWTNVADKVGLPGPRWVATIEASRYVEGRCFVCFDGHRSDDDEPLVSVTEDFGQSWKPIRGNLPTGSTRCLREDIQNPNVLYLGTEFAAWVSANRGQSWTKINNNLPTVAVHEFAQHPTNGEIVAATHGRSLWVADATPLRQTTPEVLKAVVHLYAPLPATRWRPEPGRESPYSSSARKFVGTNPPDGAQIYYALGKKANAVSLKVYDFAGKQVRDIRAAGDPGLHHLAWDLRRASLQPQEPAPGGPPGEEGQQPGGRFLGGIFRGQPVTPGMYRVVLTVDGKEFAQSVKVEGESGAAAVLIAGDDDDGR